MSHNAFVCRCFAPLLLLLLLLLCILFSVVMSAATSKANFNNNKDCHGKICDPVEEYCSVFMESCDLCEHVCNPDSHNYHEDTCDRQCVDYKKFDPLKAEIHSIHQQQSIILILLVVLLALIAVRYIYKCGRWMRRKRCFAALLKRLQPRKSVQMPMPNGKDLGGTTIQNVMAISGDMEQRAPSQIYSVTGAEGSVMTMTTPVSTRYPAENSTTPTTIAAEYSYDNQALAVTPVSDKPSGGTHGF